MITSTSARIRLGVEVLDKAHSSWRDHIDMDKLSMGIHDKCILGQIFGSYETGKTRLGLSQSDAERMAFDVIGGGMTYTALAAAWRKELTPVSGQLVGRFSNKPAEVISTFRYDGINMINYKVPGRTVTVDRFSSFFKAFRPAKNYAFGTILKDPQDNFYVSAGGANVWRLSNATRGGSTYTSIAAIECESGTLVEFKTSLGQSLYEVTED